MNKVFLTVRKYNACKVLIIKETIVIHNFKILKLHEFHNVVSAELSEL